ARLQAEQIQVASAEQWQLQDFLLVDHFPQLGIGSFHLDSVSVHADFLLGRADLQNDIHAALLVDRKNDAGRSETLKARERGLHLVSPDWKGQNPVLTGYVSCRFSDQVRVYIRRGNSNTLDGCRRRVRDHAEDR